MKKIFFDASVITGQFSKNSQIRIRCKNSQVAVSLKTNSKNFAFFTFNEIGLVDATLWETNREIQDAFFAFMDNFFSAKNALAINISKRDAAIAISLMNKFALLKPSNALSCAAAISNTVDEIQTLYADLLSRDVIKYLKSEHGIKLSQPLAAQEQSFDSNLEKLYQNALNQLDSSKVDLLKNINK